MSDPVLHEQFREIWHFIHEKCEEEAKLILVHALDDPAPACEEIVGPAKFEAWEDPSLQTDLAYGIPGVDYLGRPTDRFNWCPYCKGLVWIGMGCRIGAKLNCLHCRAEFRRTL